jgi:hypothetical protein
LRAGRIPDETIVAGFEHLAAAAPYFLAGAFQETFETGMEILLEGIRRAKRDGYNTQVA